MKIVKFLLLNKKVNELQKGIVIEKDGKERFVLI